MKLRYTLKSVRTLAATLITFGSLAERTNAATIITFGNLDVDPLVSAGTLAEDGFTYEVTAGAGWDLTTNVASSGASLVTAWNGALPAVGDMITILSETNSSFIFNSLEYATNGTSNGFDLTVTGFVSGTPVGSLSLTDDTNRVFSTIVSPFNNQIDRLEIEITGAGSYGAFIDNISLTTVPEPTSALLFGLGAIALVALRRRKN